MTGAGTPPTTTEARRTPVIEIRGLGKRYEGTTGDDENSSAGGVWALRDVTFDVERGTFLGVIGANGAGKSTLLRVLARVTPPTAGHVVIRGRVAPTMRAAASLFRKNRSVGANILLLARLFGFPAADAQRRLLEVARFAELEDALDSEVRRLSPGLLQRLAFSVALNLEPDVLLADDILVAGDSDFRRRGLDRIREANRDGLTVVFASHEADLVRRLAHEVVWLDSHVVERGPAERVLNAYASARGGARDEFAERASRKRRSFNAHVALHPASLYGSDGYETAVASVGTDVLLSVPFEAATVGAEVRCVAVLQLDATGRIVRLVQPTHFLVPAAGTYAASVLVPGSLLRAGTYTCRVGAWVRVDGAEVPLVRPNALSFAVVGDDPPSSDDDDDNDDGIEVTHLGWHVDAARKHAR